MSTSGNLYSSVQPYSVRNGRSKKRSDLTIVLELNKHCSRNFELQERHLFKEVFFFSFSRTFKAMKRSFKFSSRYYWTIHKSPHTFPPVSQKLPQRCLWKSLRVCLLDNAPSSSFQGRLSVMCFLLLRLSSDSKTPQGLLSTIKDHTSLAHRPVSTIKDRTSLAHRPVSTIKDRTSLAHRPVSRTAWISFGQREEYPYAKGLQGSYSFSFLYSL